MFGNKSVAMISQNGMIPVPEGQHENIRKAMLSMVQIVEESSDPSFPIVVGNNKK